MRDKAGLRFVNFIAAITLNTTVTVNKITLSSALVSFGISGTGNETKSERTTDPVGAPIKVATGEVKRTCQPAHREPPGLDESVIPELSFHSMKVFVPDTWGAMTVDISRVRKQRFAVDRKFIEIYLESAENLPSDVDTGNLRARVCILHHPAFLERSPKNVEEQLLSDLRGSESTLPSGQRLDWINFPSRAGHMRNQALWHLRGQLYIEPPKNLGVDSMLDIEGDDDVGVIVSLHRGRNSRRKIAARAAKGVSAVSKKLMHTVSSPKFMISRRRKQNEHAFWFLVPLRDLCRGQKEWQCTSSDVASRSLPRLRFSAEKALRMLSPEELDADQGSFRDVMCNVKIENGIEVVHINSILRLVNQSTLALRGVFEMPGEEPILFRFGLGASQFAPVHMIPSGSVKLFLSNSRSGEVVFEGQLRALLSQDRQTLHFQDDGQDLYLSMHRVRDESGEWEVSINPSAFFCNLFPVPITVRSGAFVVQRDDGWLTELKFDNMIAGFSSFIPPRHVCNGTIVRMLRQKGRPPSVFIEIEVISDSNITGFIRAKHLRVQDNKRIPHFEHTLLPSQSAPCIAWPREALERGEVAVQIQLHAVHGKVIRSGLWSRVTTIPFARASHNEAEVEENIQDDIAQGELHLVEGAGVFSIIAETDGNNSSQNCNVRLFAACWIVNRSGVKLYYTDKSDAVPLKNVISPGGYQDVDPDALVPVSLFSLRKQLKMYDNVSDKDQGITMTVKCKPKPVHATVDMFTMNKSYVVESYDGDACIGLLHFSPSICRAH